MTRHNKPEQYRNIVLKASPDGEILRLKDVATVQLLFVLDSWWWDGNDREFRANRSLAVCRLSRLARRRAFSQVPAVSLTRRAFGDGHNNSVRFAVKGFGTNSRPDSRV